MSDKRHAVLIGLLAALASDVVIVAAALLAGDRWAQLLGFTLIMALKVAIYLVVVGYLKRAEDVLEIAKAYYEMGRTQHKDATRLTNTLQQRADAAPSVLHAVQQVPEKTAEKVLDGLEKKDSGVHKKPPHPEAFGGT